MSKLSLYREEAVVTTNYLRPRIKPDHAERADYPTIMPMKAVITQPGSDSGADPGDLCWGVVDSDDEFVSDNQQIEFNPWTGARLPDTLDAFKRAVNDQARVAGRPVPFAGA